MERVAVIGAGSVGRALGAGLAGSGHEVTFGVRDPSDPRHQDLPASATLPAAASAADVLVLATPAGAIPDLVPALSLRAGHVVLDATNAVRMPVPNGFATMGDLVGSLLPDAVHLAKAFNTIGAEHMRTGQVGEQAAFLPVAGDPEAVDVALRLATRIGFDAVALGGREQFGLVEAHAQLWIQLAFGCGWGREFAFAVIRP